MGTFQAVKVKRLSDEVVSQIQQMLLEGKLQGGSRLPPEREMADQLGVSRSALREALSILESMGVIERRKSGGTFVRKLNSEKVLENIVSFSTKTDKELFEDLLEVREVLEVKAVRWAIERGTQQDLDRIEKAVNMMANSSKDESGIEADILFHLYISAATHNEVLFKLTRNIGNILRDVRERSLKLPGRKEECVREHREIFLAIQARDRLRGSKAMSQHINRVRDLISDI